MAETIQYGRRTEPVEDAARSWWLDAPTREAFTDAAEREQARMARSKVARSLNGMILGGVQKPR